MGGLSVRVFAIEVAMVAKWQAGYAESGGERIYWESAGDGIPIVICHGAGSGHLSFYQQVAGMASETIRVITWDQRGYCNSTLSSGQIGIGVSVEDLTSVVRATGLENSPLHLVGQAMGALVAASWAIAHPGLVQSLALWDGPFAAGEDCRHLHWKLNPNDKGVQATTVNRHIGQTRSVGVEFLKRDRAGTFLYQSLQELGPDRPSYAQAFAAAQAEPVPLAPLVALDVPILVGRGEFDHVADLADYETLSAIFPRAKLVVLPGCGHSPYFEQPEIWNEVTLRHVRAAMDLPRSTASGEL
jgi:pimeloyl-ACP methyl ester carboxylesterase